MSRLLHRKISLPSRRFFTTSRLRPAFSTGPAPPRLPPKEQEEFERLQKSSTGAFSTPRAINPTISTTPRSRPQINQSPASATDSKAKTAGVDVEVEAVDARIASTGKGEELHPDIRRGAKPEFEGERNPKTGEVGGPKNEPLRWGSTGDRGDWSYNGRVTDF
ncbi:putative mitochondrial protein, conserved [Cadophora gregata]|uniref:putative mitochondrial protein, conserved n=1 Tax=Cadophora gregata TaxID=51156 RepID=UPI0026DCBAC7|nr:putative mitochondrial protein, conserved [Cadophora gregata]KAK0100691.1 putative mitochondrial protein, conserved [Cadophora gregata]